MKLAKMENPGRTVDTINYLRSKQGLPPHQSRNDIQKWEDVGYDLEDDRHDTTTDHADEELPAAEIIPAQTQLALSFTSANNGPLAVLSDQIQVTIDPEQAELYSRLRKQLLRFLEEIPSQERGQVTEAIEDTLRQPDSWENVRSKKILWLCGNTLRSILSQHDAVSAFPDPHYAKLPPAAAEALRRPVETWNIVVLGDSVLRDLDARRVGPQELKAAQDQLAAVEPILDAALSDGLILTADAASAIEVSLAGARVDLDNIHVRQAKEFARGTMQNFVVQVLRGAHQVAQDLQDPQSDETKNFVKEYKSGIYKKLGEWTVTDAVAASVSAATATGTALYFYGMPFLEFVATQGPWLKSYLAIAFENRQLVSIVDAIVAIRAKLVQ